MVIIKCGGGKKGKERKSIADGRRQHHHHHHHQTHHQSTPYPYHGPQQPKTMTTEIMFHFICLSFYFSVPAYTTPPRQKKNGGLMEMKLNTCMHIGHCTMEIWRMNQFAWSPSSSHPICPLLMLFVPATHERQHDTLNQIQNDRRTTHTHAQHRKKRAFKCNKWNEFIQLRVTAFAVDILFHLFADFVCFYFNIFFSLSLNVDFVVHNIVNTSNIDIS